MPYAWAKVIPPPPYGGVVELDATTAGHQEIDEAREPSDEPRPLAEPSEEHHQHAPPQQDLAEKSPRRQRLAIQDLVVAAELLWHQPEHNITSPHFLIIPILNYDLTHLPFWVHAAQYTIFQLSLLC